MNRSERRRLKREQQTLAPEGFGDRFKQAAKIPFSFAAVFSIIAAMTRIFNVRNPPTEADRELAAIVLTLWFGAAIAAVILAIVKPYAWARNLWGTVLICAVSALPIGVVALSLIDEPVWKWRPGKAVLYALFLLFYGFIMGLPCGAAKLGKRVLARGSGRTTSVGDRASFCNVSLTSTTLQIAKRQRNV